ncbi:class I SAM-dependent methyltransferase [Selenomonas ruminantium]|uniref:Methyltransferase domain-containing protein n=1 Tax=Selenomonas ruminantium TaxID=971 RepID=A0A1H4AAA5_SELRU|nr:class I SAM-dependent methyltransferase [Selenomonas ruminantium]SEA32502.1 Methyltransferase domain-containing protein [Selenomonas ruminantium]
MSEFNIEVIEKKHFPQFVPVGYEEGEWISEDGRKARILEDVVLGENLENNSWSQENEDMHEVPTKNGWIDVYERERVLETTGIILGEARNTVVEFGASAGYMIEEMYRAFPENNYIATDLMVDGLRKSYLRNKNIMHIRCDFTDAPFVTKSVDFVYSLNVLEHIEDDMKTISECYRILKPGGYCLFVVPRGAHLYDYFDEMLFHKRRYAKGELLSKCRETGFQVVHNFHFAWLCYPAFWMKKKWNKRVGKRISKEEKMEMVKKDIHNAMDSSIAIGLMHLERKLSKLFSPEYGVREFILCRKM